MAESVLLTVRDVQEVIQLGRTKIYELMRDGQLPYLRIGRSVRFRREALEMWLAQLEQQEQDLQQVLPLHW